MTETKTFRGGLWAYLQQESAPAPQFEPRMAEFLADALKYTPFKPGETRQAHVFNRETSEWEKVTYDDSGVLEVGRLHD